MALFLDRLLCADADSDPARRYRTEILLTLLLPFLFFVHPLVGLVSAAMLLLYWIRSDRKTRAILPAAMAGVLLAAMLVPWAMRNDRVLGAPILLRSNAGLELAIAQHPGTLRDAPGDQILMDRLREVHPLQSARAFAAMKRAGGEVAYARQLGDGATVWMRHHVATAAWLMARHLRQALVPDPWIFRVWGSPIAPLQSALAIIAGVAGLAGLIAGLWVDGRRWAYVAIAIMLPALLFSPFQPVARYTYLMYAMLVFSAGGLALLRRRPDARAAR